MYRSIFFLFLFLLNLIFQNLSFALDTDAFSKTLNKISPAVSAAGTVDYKGGCATCAQNYQNVKNYSLYSKDNDQKIELSILSEDEANKLFKKIATRDDIPFGYPIDGCYARAHKMSRILEDEGIISGKAFVEGKLFVDTKFGEIGWSYHVAPVVMVRKGGSVIPYIFDPSLFDKAVPFDTWKAKMMTKPKAMLSREYYTNRFAYDPDDRTAIRSNYVEETIDDMDKTNNNYSRILAIYTASLNKK